MYFDKTERQEHHVYLMNSEWIVLSVNCLKNTALLGVFPAGLFNICVNVLK